LQLARNKRQKIRSNKKIGGEGPIL